MAHIKTWVVIGIFSLGILLGIEGLLIYGFNYRELVEGDLDCKVYNENAGFSHYRPNCKLTSKNWEQDSAVSYEFNSFGRREPDQPVADINVAFFGDSFTMGAMVPIEKNYNFKALEKFETPRYRGHNFGVAAAQFHNILAQLNFTDTNEFDLIIYGLTPNDFFNIVDGTDPFIREKPVSKKVVVNQSTTSSLKNLILSSATSRFLLHNLMKIDSVYLQTYKARKPYAGYLDSPLPSPFSFAVDHVLLALNSLDNSKRDKLIVFLLPQRAEVVAAKLGQINNPLRDYFISKCREMNFECASADVIKLSKVPESHYPVDGHLTISGNASVAEDLFIVMSNWLD